ncbi:hypothetical protein GF371_05280 [Candidatus Woesearchaeota archaeon]|nr:hypothetical protein [Candidatus Woesearchaeota archaeon]
MKEIQERTMPKPLGVDSSTDPALLTVGRYGTDDSIRIWGPVITIDYSLEAQALACQVLSEIDPDIVPPEHVKEIFKAIRKADHQKVRDYEEATGHDVIGQTRAVHEELPDDPAIKAQYGKTRTSADTTETAKARQLKESLEMIIEDTENLRDIILEKAIDWIDIPYMDTTHLYDALPTNAGRPLVHFAEILQSNLDFLRYIYENSVMGKWGDATGSHHAATALGVDGMELQRAYCEKLGINHMTAAAQIPGREYIAQIVFATALVAETVGNLAEFIVTNKSSDCDVYFSAKKKKRKGSSSMPHKDQKGGNPTAEEQAKSCANFMRGAVTTMLSSCRFAYARNLDASASDRIVLKAVYDFTDRVIRRMASVVYNLGINEQRSLERIERTYGITTSSQVLAYLTDIRRPNPMPREEAHDLMGELATEAYNRGNRAREKLFSQIFDINEILKELPDGVVSQNLLEAAKVFNRNHFLDVLLENTEVSSRLDRETLERISDPLTYTGQSREIVEEVFQKCYKEQTIF